MRQPLRQLLRRLNDLPRTSLCFVCAVLLGAMAISLFARAAFVGTA